MDWKEDRKFVLESLKDQKDSHVKILASIDTLSTSVIDKVHKLDKRTVTLEGRVKLIAAALIMAIGTAVKKLIG